MLDETVTVDLAIHHCLGNADTEDGDDSLAVLRVVVDAAIPDLPLHADIAIDAVSTAVDEAVSDGVLLRVATLVNVTMQGG